MKEGQTIDINGAVLTRNGVWAVHWADEGVDG